MRTLLLFLFLPLSLWANMIIEITAPNTTPLSESIYLAGNFNNWNPADAAYKLTSLGNFRYRITLTLPNNTAMQFKFTRGDWATVETSAAGIDIANRTATYQDGASLALTVENWHDIGSATHTLTGNCGVLNLSFPLTPQLAGTRRIWLYLPPDYTTNTAQNYPVLYLHDGQNMFDVATSFSGEWGIDEAMESIGCAPKAIVVGIDNGGATRLDEYSYWTNPSYGGGNGANYMRFIVENLKPYIDAHYRTLPDAAHTGILGSSMGGLISYCGAMEYQEVFGKVGVFSPSFWFSNQVLPFTQQQGKRGNSKFYFVCGQNESSAMVPDVDAVLSALQQLGFQTNTQLKRVVKTDGQHSEWFWKREFPAAYCWLFSDLLPTETSSPTAPNFTVFESNDSVGIRPNIPNSSGLLEVNLIDASGKLMQTFSLPAGEISYISTASFAAGIYLVQLKTATLQEVHKIMLKK